MLLVIQKNNKILIQCHLYQFDNFKNQILIKKASWNLALNLIIYIYNLKEKFNFVLLY